MSLSYLKKIALLKGLPQRQLKRVQALTQTRDVRAGAMIFDKDQAADCLFLVVSGRVKIFSLSGGRKRKIFAYLGPGTCFGEMALLVDRGRSVSAQAVEDCRLLTLHKKDFQRLLRSDARLCHALLRVLAERLYRADEEIESLLFRNILGRVAKTLEELSRGHGRSGAGGTVIAQRLTHQDLADMVGTTREPLSRALALLKRGGIVDGRRGELVIRDPAKLQDLIRASLRTD